MGFTSMKSWEESDNTADLVYRIENSMSIGSTLVDWFNRGNVGPYNTPPEVDLGLVIEGGFVNKNDVPQNILDRTVKYLSTVSSVKGEFQKDYRRLLKAVK